MLKVLKSICRKLWYLFACKKLTSSLTPFLNCWKGKANLLLWKLWECLTIAINNYSINLEETFMLICMQKVNFITYFFLKILQRSSKLDILSNLGLPGPSKMIVSIWRNFWCIFKQKINFILPVFVEILQSYRKLVILGTWAKTGYAYPKWYYHLVENFCIYLPAKKQLDPQRFSGDTAKICKLFILGTLGMYGYLHPKW